MILRNKEYAGYLTFNIKNYYMDSDGWTITAIDFDNDTLHYEKVVVYDCGCCSGWESFDTEFSTYIENYCDDVDEFIKHIEDNWDE